MLDIYQIQEEYKKQKVEKNLFEKDLKQKRRSLTITDIKISDLDEVHSVWIKLADKIQMNARSHIEAVVTMAIQSVFEKPYKFKLVFEEKRNNITCTPLVIEDGYEYSPKDQMGGGMIDIIGFALRITLWSMRVPRSRNIFILDEPFRFCGDLTLKAAVMLKKLSEKLKFQVLLVTHNAELKEVCDKVWIINNRRFSRLTILNKVFEKIIKKIRRRG